MDVVSIEVPYTELAAERNGDTYTRYVLKVTNASNESWLVSRRYKEFRTLADCIARIAPRHARDLPSLSRNLGATLFGWPVMILQRTFVDWTPCFSQPRPGF